MKPHKTTIKHTAILFAVLIIAAFISSAPASAATSDEIIRMSDAGVPADIIIDVIEATGFDDPIETETLVYLLDAQVSSDVIDFLISSVGDDLNVEMSGLDRWGPEDHPNYAGGPGFSHSESGYNPLNDPDRSGSGYYGDDGWNDDPNNYNDRNVTWYAPPVYVMRNGWNSYYYPAPRMYHYNRGYNDNGSWVIYNPDYHYPGYRDCYRDHRHDDYCYGYNNGYWYNGDWYTGRRYRGLRGNLYYDRYNGLSGSLDGWFRDNNLGFRISF